MGLFSWAEDFFAFLAESWHSEHHVKQERILSAGPMVYSTVPPSSPLQELEQGALYFRVLGEARSS